MILVAFPVAILSQGCDNRSQFDKEMDLLKKQLLDEGTSARKVPRLYSQIEDKAGIGSENYNRLQGFLLDYRALVLPLRNGGSRDHYSPFIHSIHRVWAASGESSNQLEVYTTFWDETDWVGNQIVVEMGAEDMTIVSCRTFKK